MAFFNLAPYPVTQTLSDPPVLASQTWGLQLAKNTYFLAYTWDFITQNAEAGGSLTQSQPVCNQEPISENKATQEKEDFYPGKVPTKSSFNSLF